MAKPYPGDPDPYVAAAMPYAGNPQWPEFPRARVWWSFTAWLEDHQCDACDGVGARSFLMRDGLRRCDPCMKTWRLSQEDESKRQYLAALKAKQLQSPAGR